MSISAQPYDAIVIAVHLGLLAVAVWLLIIDARTHRLPNRIVLPTGTITLALVGVDALATQGTQRLRDALLGMLILGGFYLFLRMASRGGIGGGDVKLAAVIGLVLGWHGWQALALGAALAFFLGAIYALVLMALRRANKSTRIAFGPWMIVGSVLGVLLG